MQELLNVTEGIINLFLSGFIFITVFNWLTNTKMELYIIGVWSIIINTLIKTVCKAIHSVIFVNYDFNESVKILIYVMVALIFAFSIPWFLRCDITKRCICKIAGRTLGNDVFNDIIDYEKRTIGIVYLKNSDIYYSGILRLRDEHGNNSYIVLIDYSIYNKGDNEMIRKNSKDLGLNTTVAFNMQDVERIEMFYEDDSDVWKCLNE